MVHKLSELLGTVKTTSYHPRSDGLVERFNRTLLAMLAMLVSREHDNWDDLLPFMIHVLAYNTTVHTSTGFTPHRLVFGEECSLPGNLVHRELRSDPPPPSRFRWLRLMVPTSTVWGVWWSARATTKSHTPPEKELWQQSRSARIPHWELGKDKLCSPWIGPYKIVRAPMEWVVGIQVDADARIFYVHMDDFKHCTPPEPSWPDVARGTSIVLSTRAPSTFTPTEALQSHTESGSAHQTGSVSSIEEDVRASIITDQSEDIHTDTNTQPTSVWDLQDAKCILSKNSECYIDVKGFRFYTMERLFYAFQLLTLGDKKYIRQLAKYTRMDYVKICVNTRFELASPTLQDKWLCEQFQTWTQIITARILSDTAFKQALLDSVWPWWPSLYKCDDVITEYVC